LKEATGEANMTVITVVLIAIVLGMGKVIISNMLSSMTGTNGMDDKSCCQANGGVWRDSWKKCYSWCSDDQMMCGGEISYSCD